ncbi:MAG: DMT family transporter [Proteobacteria bacterium]|nr:DMT family transporter [Pseudomonadota bacterium]
MIKRLKSNPSPKQAALELIFAASIWGFGFVCARWALDFAGPFWTNAIRFYLAFIFAVPVILATPQLKTHFNREQFFLAAWPGFFLSGTLVFQTAGLAYTSVTKSGFITVLYIVFVPFLELLLLKTKINKLHLLWVMTALVGSALICEFKGGSWNFGDLLTLVCAFMASSQIVFLEKQVPKIGSAFVFNVFQTFWAGLIPIALAIPFEPIPKFPISAKILMAMLILSFASTLLAFLIQVRSQKVLPSSTVSMLFLLESPFAALFAFFLLGERMGFLQWLGASLILFSALGAVKMLPKSRPN